MGVVLERGVMEEDVEEDRHCRRTWEQVWVDG